MTTNENQTCWKPGSGNGYMEPVSRWVAAGANVGGVLAIRELGWALRRRRPDSVLGRTGCRAEPHVHQRLLRAVVCGRAEPVELLSGAHVRGDVLGGPFSAIWPVAFRLGPTRASVGTGSRMWLALAADVWWAMPAVWPWLHVRQALTGGAMLLNGSLAFRSVCSSAGMRPPGFVRRQWHD